MYFEVSPRVQYLVTTALYTKVEDKVFVMRKNVSYPVGYFRTHIRVLCVILRDQLMDLAPFVRRLFSRYQ
jgi:hypothetical protein